MSAIINKIPTTIPPIHNPLYLLQRDSVSKPDGSGAVFDSGAAFESETDESILKVGSEDELKNIVESGSSFEDELIVIGESGSSFGDELIITGEQDCMLR